LCETRDKIDEVWEKLRKAEKNKEAAGQRQSRDVVADCASSFEGHFDDRDASKAKRVMEAMLQMEKLDIKSLKQAYGHKLGPGDGKSLRARVLATAAKM